MIVGTRIVPEDPKAGDLASLGLKKTKGKLSEFLSMINILIFNVHPTLPIINLKFGRSQTLTNNSRLAHQESVSRKFQMHLGHFCYARQLTRF